MTTGKIPMPLYTVVDGRKWRLFLVDFTTVDGRFATYIYALSFEHAAAVVEELKQTARLSGRIEGHVMA